ncbi:hypothetical protein KR215_008630, partial [Drosophila sulfurigaster]
SPRYGNVFDGHNALDVLQPLLYEISGIRELHKLILLVVHASTVGTQLKLHCFYSDTMKHLGSTCISPAELRTMQRHQMLLKYEIVYTQETLSIRSLASNSTIIESLVQRSKKALLDQKKPEPEPEPEHVIKSLRLPRITVRTLNAKRVQSNEVKKPSWKV